MKELGSQRVSLAAMVGVIALMGIVALSLPVDADSSRLSRAQSLLGLVVFIVLMWATSNVCLCLNPLSPYLILIYKIH